MGGHPRGVLKVIDKIEKLISLAGKEDLARRMQAIATGMRERTRGKTEKDSYAVALKCLHDIRKILVVPHNVTSGLPCTSTPTVHSQLCTPQVLRRRSFSWLGAFSQD